MKGGNKENYPGYPTSTFYKEVKPNKYGCWWKVITLFVITKLIYVLIRHFYF